MSRIAMIARCSTGSAAIAASTTRRTAAPRRTSSASVRQSRGYARQCPGKASSPSRKRSASTAGAAGSTSPPTGPGASGAESRTTNRNSHGLSAVRPSKRSTSPSAAVHASCATCAAVSGASTNAPATASMHPWCRSTAVVNACSSPSRIAPTRLISSGVAVIRCALSAIGTPNLSGARPPAQKNGPLAASPPAPRAPYGEREPRRVRLRVVRQARELALDIPIPPEAADRALPSAAHRLVRLAVGLVAGRDLRLEVAVLGLDDLVVVLAVVLDVAGAAELLAGHRLHGRHGTAARPWALLES